ncbi:MAG: hypothetical protein ABIK48_07935 [candidate division WOR-3 bacterium]
MTEEEKRDSSIPLRSEWQKKGKVISTGAEQSEAEWRNRLKEIPRQTRNDFPFRHFDRSGEIP